MKRIRIKLSKKEEKQLKELILGNRDRKVHQRFLCIRLLNEGKTNSAVAELLGVSLETIKNWLVIYDGNGLDGLVGMYENMRKSSLNTYSEKIQSYLNDNIITTIWEVVDYVNNELSVPVKYHAVRNFIKKNLILSRRNQCRYRLKRQKERYNKIS